MVGSITACVVKVGVKVWHMSVSTDLVMRTKLPFIQKLSQYSSDRLLCGVCRSVDFRGGV
jgi:hypothetical protein